MLPPKLAHQIDIPPHDPDNPLMTKLTRLTDHEFHDGTSTAEKLYITRVRLEDDQKTRGVWLDD